MDNVPPPLSNVNMLREDVSVQGCLTTRDDREKISFRDGVYLRSSGTFPVRCKPLNILFHIFLSLFLKKNEGLI